MNFDWTDEQAAFQQQVRTFLADNLPKELTDQLQEGEAIEDEIWDDNVKRFDAGMNEAEAARDISLAPYHDWIDAERIIVNIHTLYKDFGAQRKAGEAAPDYHALMARLRNPSSVR